jgi:CheY-like chemotaxis protein
MPKMDGAELVRQIRQTARISHVPVVLTLSEPNEYQADYLPGTVGYLVKPFRLEAVREMVGSLLGVENGHEVAA